MTTWKDWLHRMGAPHPQLGLWNIDRSVFDGQQSPTRSALSRNPRHSHHNLLDRPAMSSQRKDLSPVTASSTIGPATKLPDPLTERNLVAHNAQSDDISYNIVAGPRDATGTQVAVTCEPTKLEADQEQNLRIGEWCERLAYGSLDHHSQAGFALILWRNMSQGGYGTQVRYNFVQAR